MSEYLRVEGHQHLVRDTRTNAIVNKNKNLHTYLIEKLLSSRSTKTKR